MTKITVDKDLIEQAVDALASAYINNPTLAKLIAALAGPAVGPVAWRAKDANGRWMYGNLPAPELPADAPQLLFASPPPPAEVLPPAKRSGVFGYLDGEVRKEMAGFYAAFGMQQPTPTGVPLLTPSEVTLMWVGESFDTLNPETCYIRGVKRGEQAARQKAGLK